MRQRLQINTDYKNGKLDLRVTLGDARERRHDALKSICLCASIPSVSKLRLERDRRIRPCACGSTWRRVAPMGAGAFESYMNRTANTGMVQASEVYFAYHVPAGQTGPERTVFQMAIDTGFKALPSGKEND